MRSYLADLSMVSLALQGDPCEECPEGAHCSGKGAPPCVSSITLPLPSHPP